MAGKYSDAESRPKLASESEVEIILVYKKYPFMVPCNDYKKWEGIIYHEERRYHLLINTPHYPSLRDYSLYCSHEIHSYNSSQKTLDGQIDTLLNLLDNVEASLVSENLKDDHIENQPSLEYLKSLAQLVSDIERSAGRSNVESVDKQTSWIQLKYNDSSSQDNFIKVGLDSNYPTSVLQILDVDLPEDVLPQFGQIRRLNELYNCFVETVESLIPFWKITGDLSDEAWVIEPLEPTRKDVHRRIFLSDNLSVQLLFNPLNVDSMPDVKFLGSLTAVSEARDKYQKNVQESGWWSDSSVVSNLCRLLSVDSLPRKSNPQSNNLLAQNLEDVESNECSICYEISTEGETVPAKWCSNKNCSGRFHHYCLLEWLNSVATSKTSFDHISGPCPHCDEKIFCPIKLQ